MGQPSVVGMLPAVAIETHSALTSAREYLTSTPTAIASVLVGQRASVSSVRSNETASLALMGQIMMVASARTTAGEGVV